MRARLPLVLLGVTVVCVVLDTVITASYQSLLAEKTWAVHGWPFIAGATLGCSVMGALILARYPRHPIGWLLCVAGLASVSLVAETYSTWVLDHDGPGSEAAGRVAAWVSVLLGGALATAALTMIFLLAPDGHLPSRRWRWAAGATIAGISAYTAALLTIPPTEFEFTDSSGPPEIYGPATAVLFGVGFLLIVAGLLSSVVSLVLRVRRARGETRGQLLWIASSAAFLAVGMVFLVVMGAVQGEQTLLGATPLFVAYLAFPACTAVAVLRHRMFDIDLIVNRALVVTLATALVAAGYVLVVVVAGLAVGEGTGGFWPSLLATAVVALAFQPLRRGVVRLADRLAFGAAAAPYEALADFSRRVGESPDPSRLLPALAEATGTAVNARRATARLPIPGGTDHVATWPAAATQRGAGTQVDVPVVDRGEPLGTLSVELPAGRDLRANEARLLQDLADQAAIAFRNARLSAELAERVEQLDRHTAELAESRRRLITAGDAERSRLERRIAQEVAPHLRPLPVRLEELAHATNGALPTSLLPPLVASSAAALEALREITRGVFPAQLARVGLEPALGSLLGRSGGRLVTEPSASGRRFDHRLEAAAYFCVAEAVRDMSAAVEVVLGVEGDELRLQISGCERDRLADDAMRDRVETVGGTVTHRTVDGATVVEVRVPAQVPARAPS